MSLVLARRDAADTSDSPPRGQSLAPLTGTPAESRRRPRLAAPLRPPNVQTPAAAKIGCPTRRSEISGLGGGKWRVSAATRSLQQAAIALGDGGDGHLAT